ncbi:ABC transporter ATP-binding protein [Serratia marcescens]|jgi:ABC-type cobalamin/Fe3+-siderophores transport systems, ATPase components|uniref:ABC transporter ATP-binding protein n=2 Tax=Serratia TaxID=613 RepID=A0ABD5BGX1_SERMA|nr:MULTISPECIES: ABC transporter ATP-binding protein [Serratia]MCK1091709.1 ABC transporter ATP-binding protein [Serratia marcescens]MCS3412633.1 ABC transporter ATP-binding protein [Serratia marcescens]MCW7559610.1 ABC transporter ATP-binding protein [Serratia marcescens]MCW7564598.1 ABC transporter ATP-binding protein [Serratia marcescens]MCW7569600.1 ABC transporter ATP-binding protein [Serratia marcescens]
MKNDNAMSHRLHASHLKLGYDNKIIADDLSVAIPDGAFTVIVGPNACGKSTLLRALCRLLKPSAGEVMLDGKNISNFATKALARELGLLPQTSIAPDSITVADLVSRGRYPHQSLLKQWTQADKQAVEAAMAATNVGQLADRSVDELSGGQRQRVWVAMALAQQTPLLLLDEPTTYLDIAHQIELLDLFRQLNREHGQTLIAVLHDLNHACRYADHIIAMRDGKIVAEGKPAEIITAELVERVFGMPCMIIDDPLSHTPLVIPRGRYHCDTPQA